jgi:Flp pilus assembly protein TadD
MLLADSLMRKRDKTDAIRSYEGLIDSDNPVVLNNLAWLYMERGDKRALEMARRALELAPNSSDIVDTLGWILLQNGETGKAVEHLMRSVQLNPGNASVQYHLGVAHRDDGDRVAARQSLEEALDIGNLPELESARSALEQL